MVGLIGCGCCTCCPEPTSDWTDGFTSTPVADGNPFDVVRNITGPGCRSYPPTTTVKSKVSQLHINADNTSPLYLGFNGYPRGAVMRNSWTDDKADFGVTPSTQSWTLPVPTSKTLRNEMSVGIKTRVVLVFGGTEIQLGISAAWYKDVGINTSTGLPSYRYRRIIYGYKVIGSGAEVVASNYDSGWGTQALRILLITRHRFLAGLEQNDCRSISEGRGFQTLGITCGDLLDPGFCIASPTGTLSYNNEKIECNVGWKTDVTWQMVQRSPGTGAFSFGPTYIRWFDAKWNWFI